MGRIYGTARGTGNAFSYIGTAFSLTSPLSPVNGINTRIVYLIDSSRDRLLSFEFGQPVNNFTTVEPGNSYYLIALSDYDLPGAVLPERPIENIDGALRLFALAAGEILAIPIVTPVTFLRGGLIVTPRIAGTIEATPVPANTILVPGILRIPILVSGAIAATERVLPTVNLTGSLRVETRVAGEITATELTVPVANLTGSLQVEPRVAGELVATLVPLPVANLTGSLQTQVRVSGEITATPIQLTSLTLEFPSAFQTFQMNEALGTGAIRFKGTYEPDTISANFEARQGTTGNWTAIGTGIGGEFDLDFVVPPSQGTVMIRPVGQNNLETTVLTVGVGDVYLISGDSYSSGRIIANQNVLYVAAELPADRRFTLTYFDNGGRWRAYSTAVPLDATVSESGEALDFAEGRDSAATGRRSHWPRMAQLLIAAQSTPRPIAFQVNPRGGATAGIRGDSVAGIPVGTSPNDFNRSWLPVPGDRDARKNTNTLYGIMLTQFDNSGNRACKAVLTHLGTNDVIQSEPSDAFEIDLIAFGDAIANDYNCPLFVPILQDLTERFGATRLEGGEQLQNLIRQKIIDVAAASNNVYSGGDLSGIVPTPENETIPNTGGTPGDGLHIMDETRGLQLAQIWADALIAFSSGSVSGMLLPRVLISGSIPVVGAATPLTQLTGTLRITPQISGEIEAFGPEQTLLEKAIALWNFDENGPESRRDEVNLEVLETYNTFGQELRGGSIPRGQVTLGSETYNTLNLLNSTVWLKTARPARDIGLVPTSTNAITYSFWTIITGTDDQAWFMTWEAGTGFDGPIAFDYRTSFGYRVFLRVANGDQVEYTSGDSTAILDQWVHVIIKFDSQATGEKASASVRPAGNPAATPVTTSRTTGNEPPTILSNTNTLRVGNTFTGFGGGNRVVDGQMALFYVFDGLTTAVEDEFLYNNGNGRLLEVVRPLAPVEGSLQVNVQIAGAIAEQVAQGPAEELSGQLLITPQVSGAIAEIDLLEGIKNDLFDASIILLNFNEDGAADRVDDKSFAVFQTRNTFGQELLGGSITRSSVTLGDQTFNVLELNGSTVWLKTQEPARDLGIVPTSSNALTYSFWVRLTTAQDQTFVITWETGATGPIALEYDDTNGYRAFLVDSTGANTQYTTGVGTAIQNEWTHILAKFDSQSTGEKLVMTIRRSSDPGAAILTTTLSSGNEPVTIADNANQMRVGNTFTGFGGGNRVIDGEIGRFYIFNRLTTPEEDAYLYNNGNGRSLNIDWVTGPMFVQPQIAGNIEATFIPFEAVEGALSIQPQIAGSIEATLLTVPVVIVGGNPLIRAQVSGEIVATPVPSSISVQDGAFGFTNTPQTVAIASVVPEQAFLTFGFGTTSGQPNHLNMGGRISSATQLTFQTSQDQPSPAPVHWYVVSADDPGVITVQRGLVTPAANQWPLDVGITAVDTTKSFPLVYMNTGGSSFGNDDSVNGDLINATTLRLDIASPSGNRAVDWQVVTIEDSSVQRVPFNMGGAGQSNTTLPQAVDPSRTFLVVSQLFQNSGGGDEVLALGRFPSGASTTTVEIVRNNGGVQVDGAVFAVSALNDSFSVQHISINLAQGTTIQVENLPSTVPIDSTFCMSSGKFGFFGTTNNTQADLQSAAFKMELLPDPGDPTRANRVEVERASGTGTANIIVQVISF